MSVQCEITAQHAAGSPMGFFERYLSVWVALATVVGVLVEVPVMRFLVRIVNGSRGWFERSGVAAEAMN
jgi:ACR3 family arsenite efflux pump ArsB